MPTFDYRFTVDAPLAAVSAFHIQPGALKKLTPPLMIMQVHHSEPPSDGSINEFTMWLGPLPVFWKAIHSHVSAAGFTDTQAKGPMKFWQHTHRFTAIDDVTTEVHDHVEYQHHSGCKGVKSRLLFNYPALRALFVIRKRITRTEIRRALQQHATE